MKPIKNRIFCHECKRAKMLFESESKALNFIKFNANEIENETGMAPSRSYFCIVCNGWHITSQKNIIPNLVSKSERVLNEFRDMKVKKKEAKLKNAAKKTSIINENLSIIYKLIIEVEESIKKVENEQGTIQIEKAFSHFDNIKDIDGHCKTKKKILNLLSELNVIITEL